MAPTFRHGRRSRFLVSSVDASTVLNNMTLTSNVDTADTTTYGDDDRNFIGGLRDGTITVEGLFDGSTAGSGEKFAAIRSSLGSNTPVVMTAIPAGPGGSTVTPGSLARMGQSRVTSFEVNAPALNVVQTKFTAQVDGRLDYGRTLYGPGAAKTSTFVGTAVDGGSSSTGGGVGHLHVTAASTLGTMTVKVQHSTATGTGWADLITFTASTDVTVQRSTVSGNIRRYTRANVTTYTGGAAKSVNLVVAFARRGKTV